MSKKVLIVEDEFIVANDLKLILTRANYNVTGIVASANEADEHLETHKPDLVILDIRLNGKRSGIDLARKFKKEHIAFIYLSANSNEDVLEEAKKTEPYGFLVKPFKQKDLLVMLDIAWYRHTHSLESKLRQEERLHKQLADITAEASSIDEKLLNVARAMQSFIPFDFISMGTRPLNAAHFGDAGYLRIGFDDYQFIGEKELINITRLSKQAFTSIIQNTHIHNEAGIFSNAVPDESYGKRLLQRTLSDNLQLESYIVFPVVLAYGLSVHYFFYSRQANIYTKDHIILLTRLKALLEPLAETIVYHQTASAVTKTKNDKPAHHVSENIIGSHHLLLSALDLATQVAPYNTSVLILGESGTGKEKVAQFIHEHSARKSKPFIKVNCAAIPPTLVESELFGHEKGAFTGAIEKRKGKFELANGGTIFLDEIGELPLAIQVKLLRTLQEREIEYVGGNAPVKIDVRIIAATNRNLEKEVANGTFRLDLYYRLNVFPITLPPLRERKTDIEALALFFAKRFCYAFNKPFNGIASSMIDEMHAYHWPGNIRELENVIEQSVVLNNGNSPLALKRNLPAYEPAGKNGINTLEDVKHIQRQTERDYIISILKQSKGRIRGANGAAEILNINPSTLESKMAKLGIKKGVW